MKIGLEPSGKKSLHCIRKGILHVEGYHNMIISEVARVESGTTGMLAIVEAWEAPRRVEAATARADGAV